jgi:hypothetical protein
VDRSHHAATILLAHRTSPDEDARCERFREAAPA